MQNLICPTCGAALGGRAVCAQCGTLAGLEFKASRFAARIRARRDTIVGNLSGRLGFQHFLWACAVLPLFLLPALVSLVYAIFALRKGEEAAKFSPEWLAIVACLNLILSAVILYKYHLSPLTFFSYLQDAVQRLLQDGIGVGFPRTPPLKSTPI